MRQIWICQLVAVAIRLSSSAALYADDDLKELARSVRWRHLDVLNAVPEDLEIDLPREVLTRRIGEFVYGTPESPRVAVVVAENHNGTFTLYVDSNRDRKISQHEEIQGSGSLRILPLSAQQVVDFVVDEFPRKVLIRWESGDSTIGVATATFVDHTVAIERVDGVTEFSTRQIDGNANGLFADTKDLLQVDINADGRFDPFLETFPFQPVVKIRGERWFVKADRFGQRLQLSPAAATGRVKVVATAQSPRDHITELVVSLAGDDGSVYSLTGLNAETELPTGRYAASVLFIKIIPEGTERPWEFTFSREGGIRKDDWLTVTEHGLAEFDPIGEMSLHATFKKSERDGGTSLSIQPRLVTGSGLLINLCHIEGDSTYPGLRCSVSMMDDNGNVLVQSSSGFA